MPTTRYARRFASNTDKINLAAGATAIAVGPAAIAILCRRLADGVNQRMFCGSTGYEMGAFATNNACYSWNNSNIRSSNPITAGTAWSMLTADGFEIVVMVKQGSSGISRFYRYILSAATWTEGDDAGENDIAAPANWYIGNTDNNGYDIISVALFNSALADATVRGLTTQAAWQAASPVGMWMLDQSSVSAISDLTGNGANESSHTGTSAVSFADAGVDAWYPAGVTTPGVDVTVRL